MTKSDSFDDNKDIINQQNDYKLIDKIDQRLIDLLLRGYTNKKIALEAGSPLSTIQRRIRKIFENEYIHKKNELNHRKLGLRKGYLLISLKGDYSDQVARKISSIEGIVCISLVTGSIDILCVCLFIDTNHLFKIIESIKTVERVEKVSWSEEVRVIPSKQMTISSLEGFISNSLEPSDSYSSSNAESMS
jgi:DNA-binding Lrp family transcriptional regulator